MIKNWTINLVKLFHSVKDENLHWQTANHQQLSKLRQARIIQEQELAAQLQKKSVQLAHELALLKTRHDAELSMFRTRCEQDIKDYKHYLKALEQLKSSIQNSYAHLPEAVAFTIHHHAKQLLNKMWETENFEEKMRLEMRLIHFMAVVYEDTRLYLENGNDEGLPEKTLALIQQR